MSPGDRGLRTGARPKIGGGGEEGFLRHRPRRVPLQPRGVDGKRPAESSVFAFFVVLNGRRESILAIGGVRWRDVEDIILCILFVFCKNKFVLGAHPPSLSSSVVSWCHTRKQETKSGVPQVVVYRCCVWPRRR